MTIHELPRSPERRSETTRSTAWLRLAQTCTAGTSAGVGFSTFSGLRDYSVEVGGVMGWALPISIGLAVTVALGACWHALLEGANNNG
jgi:hypothetical protein